MMNNLSFNYHDAILETIQFQQNKLEITISLYNILYPTRPKVQLRIENISNSITCEKWISELTESYHEDGEDNLGARINNIYLDENNNHQMLIAVDSIKTVKLKFSQLTEIITEN